ncbi:hypothetical protein CDD81_6375 [Ophiocordyceps australis]|uniref:Very-long-chain (3R)-3-hydroxyacyl-CoA dehydratase n=1 Tax=Ophiocordyceps australis TaxID=1399860 RepID=A0A2C5Y7V9_9HYPO|nr:hypothetical protein CDD81_6375 [Ophiocordyceps australis]
MASKSMPASSPRTAYLIAYNAASALAWAVVLGRTLAVSIGRHSPQLAYAVVGHWTKWTQTMAALEVVHSLLGLVGAPWTTTLMQVASRYLLVWGIVNPFPYLALMPVYASMLTAWSIAEVIRYSYFALSLARCRPAALTWLRYNSFVLLYPIGILSECCLVYLATEPAGVISPLAKYALYAVLVVYVPGSYVLFSHMVKQRRKVMGSARAKDQKARQ